MSYEPRSLNPNIMEKRINDLSKASGTGAIPIASAETLGGIKVPADSGITVTGSGNAYAYKPIDFSTVEKNTGRKWIDGKDIYEKIIDYTGALGSTATELSSGIDYISNIIDARCIADNGVEGVSAITVWLDGTVLKGRALGNFSSQLLHIVIEYTKTEE